MNAEERRFKHGELTRQTIGAFFSTYNELGHGFLESVYEAAMEIVLQDSGLNVVRQKPLQVHFRGRVIGDYRSDLLVEQCVLVELKAARTLDSTHEAQLLNYLRASQIEVGLLLNFGPKPEFRRMSYDNDRKHLTPLICTSMADIARADGLMDC